MKPVDPLSQLGHYQALLLDLVGATPAADVTRQFHKDLSPLGWHLGHCVFTETHWVREVLLGETVINEEHRTLYIPERSPKYYRGSALPGRETLCRWAEDRQRENHTCLQALLADPGAEALLENGFLPRFLARHYAQHIETATYVLTQRELQEDTGFCAGQVLQAQALDRGFETIEGGEYLVGAPDPLHHYDNECPQWPVELDSFAIANRPVSNAEFLGFMEDGGYHEPRWWSRAGWRWRSARDIDRPQHWRVDRHGHYFGTDASGPCDLAAEAAVTGLNYYEAQALASWAGASLPHEYQWEVAKKAGALQDCGQAWEWCENTLHAYPGFEAFPYEGYSLPWFDGHHYTLRGHSPETLPINQGDCFRNFYQADKRHFPAGLRLLAPA